jgi:hypothetical protein
MCYDSLKDLCGMFGTEPFSFILLTWSAKLYETNLSELFLSFKSNADPAIVLIFLGL